MNIAGSSDEDSFVPADHGELYQNQEGDPEVQEIMRKWWKDSDELPDLATTNN